MATRQAINVSVITVMDGVRAGALLFVDYVGGVSSTSVVEPNASFDGVKEIKLLCFAPYGDRLDLTTQTNKRAHSADVIHFFLVPLIIAAAFRFSINVSRLSSMWVAPVCALYSHVCKINFHDVSSNYSHAFIIC